MGGTGWLAEALAYAWGDGLEHPVEHLASIGPMPSPQGAVEAGVEVGAPTAPRSGPAPAAKPDSGAPRPVEPRRPLGESPGATSHLSVVDDGGLAVSMTQTLGGSFGSGPVEGLGFFYQRGHAAEEAPMVPTVATREGRPELVLGSPGGERGVAAVVQVLFRVLEMEQPLEDAIGARRLYVSRATPESRGRVFFEGVGWQDTLSVRESAYAEWGASVDVLARARGFEVGEQGRGPVVEGLHPWFGGVNAIRRSGASWEAVGDDRRGGVGGVLQKGAPTLQRTDAGVIRPPAAPEG
jgi:gamma-glutamyltranspeptidase